MKKERQGLTLHRYLTLQLLLLALIIVLLPVVAAVVLTMTNDQLSETAFWSGMAGSMIIALVVTYGYARFLFAPFRKLQAEGHLASAVTGSGANNRLEQFLLALQEKQPAAIGRGGMDAETGELADQTASVSAQLTATTDETSRATNEISGTIQEIGAGMDEQANAIQEINATASQIFFSLKEVAESINFVTDSSKAAISHSKSGNQAVEKITQQMDLIHRQVHRSIDVVHELGEKTGQVEEILSLITDISNQTNLLALNAAIEAARAGEHGRGFSVVADEVRKLAEQTNQATGKIQYLIKEIQDGTAQVVEVIKQGGDSVQEGVALNQEVGKVFKDIYSNVDEVDEFIQDLSLAVQDVTNNMNQVARSIENVSSIVSQTNGSIQNVAAVIEELNASMQEVSASAVMLADIAQKLQKRVRHV